MLDDHDQGAQSFIQPYCGHLTHRGARPPRETLLEQEQNPNN